MNAARAAGKTHALVQWLKEDPENRVILCHAEFAADNVRRQYGLTRGQVMSYRRVTWGSDGPKEYVIDNADLILQNLFIANTGSLPSYVTTSLEEVHPREQLD